MVVMGGGEVLQVNELTDSCISTWGPPVDKLTDTQLITLPYCNLRVVIKSPASKEKINN